jgi:cytochrome c oxidase assembly protein subunit 11
MSDSPDRHLVWKVAGIGVAMFAFGFALVPLYDVLCAVTGYGGKTAAAAVAVVETPDASRTVRVEFLSSVARGTPFTLEPEVSHLEVHPGQLYKPCQASRRGPRRAISTKPSASASRARSSRRTRSST